MKLCLMILSVPWYMFNGLEHTAILSHILTLILNRDKSEWHVCKDCTAWETDSHKDSLLKGTVA
jgi:hypothetical protein